MKWLGVLCVSVTVLAGAPGVEAKSLSASKARYLAHAYLVRTGSKETKVLRCRTHGLRARCLVSECGGWGWLNETYVGCLWRDTYRLKLKVVGHHRTRVFDGLLRESTWIPKRH